MAQQASTPPAEPAPPLPPVAATPTFAVTPASSPIVSSQAAGCGLGDHVGIPDDDAATVAKIVCGEVYRVVGPTPPALYRVEIARLGRMVLLSVGVEPTASQGEGARASRSIRLEGVEDVPAVAPSLVQGLVERKAVAESTLLGTSADEVVARANKGRVQFGLGILGMQALGAPANVVPGMDLHLFYETPRFGAGATLRFGGTTSSDRAQSASFFSFGVGGDYYLLREGDVSPYVGGGLAFVGYSVRTRHSDFDGGSSGLGAYGQVGVEFLRRHHTHLAFSLRGDVPFFGIEDHRTDDTRSRYYVPLTLAATVRF